jgi:transcriptional regulator of acetoin/glycerol metabolism
LVALVYLRAAKPDYDGVVEVTPLLAEAAAQGQAAPESSPVDTYLESALQEDIERRRLVLLLRRHEWNISRVARELGVTRQTVYNRLQALGIDREPRDTTRKVQAEVLLQRSRA